MKSLFEKWNSINLVNRIIAGIILGVVFALLLPDQLSVISIFGSLFINALKAVAPILVFILVIHAIASHVGGKATNMKMVVMLYIVGTFVAGFVAVVVSYIFPTTLVLKTSIQEIEPPSGIAEVLEKLLFNMVSNPVSALMDANYLGILTWAVILGFAFKAANDTTKTFISNASDAITKVVQWVISLAPLGIMGLVFETISTTGFDTLSSYGRLIMILVGTMFFIALVINPLLVFIVARRNPYPLVFASLKESGVAAFFTRSSAANIPVNMALAEKLGLNKDTYAISIPLGATINMGARLLRFQF